MNIVDTAIARFNDTREYLAGQAEQWSQQWQQQYDAMRAKAREFVTLYDELNTPEKARVAAKDPALNDEYKILMRNGAWIKSTIGTMLDDDDLMGSLNALPLVPIAVVLAFIATMTAWVTDAYTLSKKVDIAEKMLAQGKDPSTVFEQGGVMQHVATTTKELSKLAPIVVGAVALWKFWPDIRNALK